MKITTIALVFLASGQFAFAEECAEVPDSGVSVVRRYITEKSFYRWFDVPREERVWPENIPHRGIPTFPFMLGNLGLPADPYYRYLAWIVDNDISKDDFPVFMLTMAQWLSSPSKQNRATAGVVLRVAFPSLGNDIGDAKGAIMDEAEKERIFAEIEEILEKKMKFPRKTVESAALLATRPAPDPLRDVPKVVRRYLSKKPISDWIAQNPGDNAPWPEKIKGRERTKFVYIFDDLYVSPDPYYRYLWWLVREGIRLEDYGDFMRAMIPRLGDDLVQRRASAHMILFFAFPSLQKDLGDSWVPIMPENRQDRILASINVIFKKRIDAANSPKPAFDKKQ